MPNLKLLMLTGCFIQLAGVVGFAVYLALAVTLDQGNILSLSFWGSKNVRFRYDVSWWGINNLW